MTGAHLSEEEIAAVIDGMLDEQERRCVVEHLADCSSCREVLADAARFRESQRHPSPADALSLSRRSSLVNHGSSIQRLRGGGWQIAVAAGVVLAIAMTVLQQWNDARAATLAPLTEAAGRLDRRELSGRVSELPYRPFITERGANEDLDPAEMRLSGAAGEALRVTRGRTDAESKDVAGVAALLAKRPAAGVENLEQAVALAPRNARYRNDLAVALLEVGRRGNAWALARALAAADHALHLEPDLPAARFNYALALEELHLDSPAALAFAAYLIEVDGTSPWADEARARLQRLRRKTAAESWDRVKDRLAAKDPGRPAPAEEIQSIATAFRQQARGTAEVELLGDWGEAELQGNAAVARTKLETARQIALALRTAGGDTFLTDVITAIDAAPAPRRRLLARAHVLYRHGRQLQRDRRSAEAEPIFEEAEEHFRRADDPMALLVGYWIANCRSDGAGGMRALPAVRALRSRLPPSYRNLRALLTWQEGVLLNRLGLSSEALVAYNTALEIFVALDERNSAAYMRNAVAAMDANLGRNAEAWFARIELFQSASASGRPELLQMVLYTAAQTELAAGHDDVAHSLFALAAHVRTPNARLRFDSRLWHSMTAARLGWTTEASDGLDRARADGATITDPHIRASAENDLRLAAALQTPRPSEAIGLFTDYLDAAAKLNEPLLVPHVLVERARAFRRAGAFENAKKDVNAALTLFERRADGVGVPDFRDRYFATFDEAVTELVDLTDATGTPAETLAAQERWRGAPVFRSAGTANEPVDAETSIREIPAGVVVAEYITLPDRMLVFSIERGRMRLERVPVERAALKQMISAHTDAVRHGRDDPSMRQALSRLFIDPVIPAVADATTFVVVPDVTVDGLTFAALRAGHDDRSLVERTSIVFAPTLSAYLDRIRRSPTPPWPGTAAVIGNPAFDQQTFALEPLGAAEAEARAIGAFYGTAPIIGGAATKEHVIAALSKATVAQIGAHALVDSANPDDSYLVLAKSNDDVGMLRLSEIARLRLQSMRLAVVAGCRTARAAQAPRQLRNLALAFLAAGVTNVVASSWDLDDAIGQDVSLDFHRRVAAGASPAMALREVQRMMMRSLDPRMRSTAAWASLRIYGDGR